MVGALPLKNGNVNNESIASIIVAMFGSLLFNAFDVRGHLSFASFIVWGICCLGHLLFGMIRAKGPFVCLAQPKGLGNAHTNSKG